RRAGGVSPPSAAATRPASNPAGRRVMAVTLPERWDTGIRTDRPAMGNESATRSDADPRSRWKCRVSRRGQGKAIKAINSGVYPLDRLAVTIVQFRPLVASSSRHWAPQPCRSGRGLGRPDAGHLLTTKP